VREVRFAPVSAALVPCHQAAMGAARKTKTRRTNMTDTNNQTSTLSKAPTHVAYQVRDREGKKGFWTRIGSAWAHGDGKGFNIQVEVIPLDGRITLRVISETKD
jgi:hypothetical protein